MDVKDIFKLVRFSQEKMGKIPLFDSDKMLIDLYTLLPGQAQRVHTHKDQDKLYYALEGEVMITLGEEETLLVTGMAALARAGVAHGVRNESGNRAVLLVVTAPRP